MDRRVVCGRIGLGYRVHITVIVMMSACILWWVGDEANDSESHDMMLVFGVRQAIKRHPCPAIELSSARRELWNGFLLSFVNT